MCYTKITISGKICTGKSSLFKNLADKLHWPTFSTGNYFRRYTKKYKLDLNMAEEQTDSLAKMIDGKVKKMLNKSGYLIVDSWLAGIMADDIADVLKVLLVAKNTIRYSRFAKRENISFAEAKRLVDQRDKSWFTKVSTIYHRRDFFNKNHYDLIVDTSDLNKRRAVAMVLKKIKKINLEG